METLLGFGALGMHASELITSTSSPLSIRIPPFHNLRRISRRSPQVSFSRSSLSGKTAGSEQLAGDDIMLMFLEERQLHGDFISRASDMIWRRDVLNSGYVRPAVMEEQIQPLEGSKDEDLSGFLKLTRTQEWISGNDIAPFNKKMDSKKLQNDSERRKRINLLKYEALKRELLLLTTGIGTACTGYCFFTFSVEAAVSYAAGVLFSCLYLQLLYRHADNVSKDVIPQIFMMKKVKRVGIRSDDLKNAFDRTVNGSIMALSSPRLVIPAAIYGFWLLFHHFPNINFDFQTIIVISPRAITSMAPEKDHAMPHIQQKMTPREQMDLVPAMFGMFAYKAACLVQVYRDNEDLLFEFPENEDRIDN